MFPVEVPDEAKDIINARECIKPEQSNVTDEEQADPSLPLIDIFINPSENSTTKKNFMIESQEKKAKDYFKQADMKKLYPNLFKLLWYSSLPCIALPGLSTEYMIKSCEFAGEKVGCEKIFNKVPTDLGMCCAFKSEVAVKESSIYGGLVKEMQESTDFSTKFANKERKHAATSGMKYGLKIT